MEDKKVFGALICCSSAGIMKPERIKDFIDKLSAMGYNLLELCTDDTYKIDEEPYFGYLRGGYTKEELKDLDAYAASKGIELVPSIQTLAHLNNLVKLPCYASIVDIDDILLVDDPRTYELVENMFKTLRECYSTHKVNIGFDEAHKIGRGKYLDKHGYVNRYEILLHHLNKVVEIAAKYDFKVHMWSDMFFRIANKGNYYGKGIHIPEEVRKMVPPSAGICYWDYDHLDEEIYDEMLKSHEEFGNEVWFAGCGGFTSNGFAPFNHIMEKSTLAAMKQVRKHNIKNVIMTIWDDDGHDCPYYTALPSLYCAKQFYDGNFDMDSIKKGFKAMFGVEYDDFLMLDLPNKTKFNQDFMTCKNPCKCLLFNDCFVGWKDGTLYEQLPTNFGDHAKVLEELIPKFGEYKYLPDFYAKLCRVLEIKAELGIRTRDAYQKGDKEALKKLVPEYKECARRLEVFTESMRSIWMTDNKPYGWEIHTIRLGGLKERILDCARRLEDYLSGKDKEIPELNEKILLYADWGLQWNRYRDNVTVSTL